MLYELNNLIKKYNDRTVINIKSLSLEEGKITGLLGPNGAGKTTLLEMLALILKPSSGELVFKNKKIKYDNSKLLEQRRKVVLVQQSPILFTASVYNNVAFPLKIRKIAKEKIKATVDELLELVGLSEFMNSQGQNLSGGETQRIAIAQALACTPEVILLDEPTSSVDVENRGSIEKIIRDINLEKGISVIFTSHDMIQASRISDNTIYINNGSISSSIHENIFNGKIFIEGERKYCAVQEDLIFPVNTGESGPVRISISPTKINVLRNTDYSKSKGYILSGRVIQLTDESDRIRIFVKAEIPIILLLDKDEYHNNRINIGESILVECPADSIEII
jgi:tungstate transport system ATP-binding protein